MENGRDVLVSPRVWRPAHSPGVAHRIPTFRPSSWVWMGRSRGEGDDGKREKSRHCKTLGAMDVRPVWDKGEATALVLDRCRAVYACHSHKCPIFPASAQGAHKWHTLLVRSMLSLLCAWKLRVYNHYMIYEIRRRICTRR